MENNLSVSYKVKYILSHDPVTPLIHIYPRENKIYVYMETCIWTLIVALFVITKNEKQLKYPTVDE